MEIETPTIADLTGVQHTHATTAAGGKLAFWREFDTGDGVYTASAVMYQAPCVLNHSFPANLTGSEFYCTVAPADGNVVITLKQAGSSVATVTFTTGQAITTPGSMSSAGWSATAGGGKFQIVYQTPADSAFAGLHGAMIGTRY